MIDKHCKNCKYYEGHFEKGGCHRHPPMLKGSKKLGCNVFPLVLKEMWCGEFRTK